MLHLQEMIVATEVTEHQEIAVVATNAAVNVLSGNANLAHLVKVCNVIVLKSVMLMVPNLAT